MTKQIAFVLIIALRLAYNPAKDQKALSPFASPSPLPASTISLIPGDQNIHTGASERLIMKWIIGDNRPASCLQPVNEIYETVNNPGIEPCIQLNKGRRANNLLLQMPLFLNHKKEDNG